MARSPSPLHWSVGLAALVGAVAGSFLGSVVPIYAPAAHPLLGGDAAIYVGTLLGAIAGAAAGSIVAFVLARLGRPALGAVVGSLAGLAAGAASGAFAEPAAADWVRAFSGDPLAAAFFGGAIGGTFVGIAAGVGVLVFQRQGTPVKEVVRFGGMVGALGGVLAGLGGGSIGATLAQSTTYCPNAAYNGAACPPGLLQGAILLGVWGGGLLGAIAGLLTAEVLTFLAARRRSPDA